MDGYNERWIRENIDKLKEIEEKVQDEAALKSYVNSLIRLLNGLMQVEKTFFHQYEKKILVEPMRLFCQYFQEQVIKAIRETSPEKKVQYINDIEEALCTVVDIYENVINGTANSDKQMFMATPMNSSLYEISPKLYAWYEELISDIVKLYDENEPRYSFLLNPTLKNSLSAKTLFNERIESGKVVVINMPVRTLDDITNMPLYIMHEMFHVLTKKQRNRKGRAYYLMFLTLNQLGTRILKSTSFSDDETIHNKICTQLFDKWFLDIQISLKEKFDELDYDDRFFYSMSIRSYLENMLLRKLVDIYENLEQDILGRIYKDNFTDNGSISEFNEYSGNINKLIQQIGIIRANIFDIRYSNRISYIIDRLLFFFREIYADMMCLWTSGYSIERYEEAFRKTVNFNIVESQMQEDDNHKIRQNIIKMVFGKEADIGKNMDNEKLQLRDTDSERFKENYIIADKNFFEGYTNYFRDCIHEMDLYIYQKGKKEQLENFRKHISRIINNDPYMIEDILLGR